MRGFIAKLTVVLFVLSVVTLGIGIYKLTVYVGTDSYFQESRNAYVGGDAYNYIINAGQATAYFVLSVGSFISALLTGLIGRALDAEKSLGHQLSEIIDMMKKINERQIK